MADENSRPYIREPVDQTVAASASDERLEQPQPVFD
jgi:hypothetical protein